VQGFDVIFQCFFGEVEFVTNVARELLWCQGRFFWCSIEVNDFMIEKLCSIVLGGNMIIKTTTMEQFLAMQAFEASVFVHIFDVIFNVVFAVEFVTNVAGFHKCCRGFL
jgi:hypothetical protein